MRIQILLWLVTFVTLGLSGCETTGNPKDGGIFWSREKNDARLAEFSRQAMDVQAEAERMQEKSQQLDFQLRNTEEELAAIKARFQHLLTETARLREKLTALESEYRKKSTHKQRLQADYDDLTDKFQQMGDIVLRDPSESEPMVQRIEALNKSYQQAILLLLE